MDDSGVSVAPAEHNPFGDELELCQFIIDTELERRRARAAARVIAQSSNRLTASLSGGTATSRKPMRNKPRRRRTSALQHPAGSPA
jgi:hypothetical protein